MPEPFVVVTYSATIVASVVGMIAVLACSKLEVDRGAYACGCAMVKY
jgi:hypothetical protein